jgi:hypothetical protein
LHRRQRLAQLVFGVRTEGVREGRTSHCLFFVQGPVVFIIYLQGASATRFPACQRFMPSSAAVVLRKKNRDENDVGGQIAAPQRTGDRLRA